MKIAIIGGSGFIGYNILQSQKDKGNEVVSIQRNATWYVNDIADQIRLGDIRDKAFLHDALKGVDIAYHMAYPGSLESRDSNLEETCIKGTKNILDVSKEVDVEKVIVASSVASCGMFARPIIATEDDVHIVPNMPYNNSKIKMEEICRNYEGVNIVIARIAKVYGAGDYKGHDSGLLQRMNNRSKPILVPPGGGSYVPMGDLVKGLELLAERGERGETYIVSSRNVPYSTIFRKFRRSLESKVPLVRIPSFTSPFFRIGSPLFPKKMRELVVKSFSFNYTDSSKLRELGWSPSRRISDGINDQVDFYLRNN